MIVDGPCAGRVAITALRQLIELAVSILVEERHDHVLRNSRMELGKIGADLPKFGAVPDEAIFVLKGVERGVGIEPNTFGVEPRRSAVELSPRPSADIVR